VNRERLLTLWELIFFGVVLLQSPVAAIPLFGIGQQLSGGHVSTAILIPMFAMGVTAVSYGRMAALFPSAGSSYTYVAKGLNPFVGFLTGWAIVFDYLLQPLICTVWVSTALHNEYLPGVPYAMLAAIVAGAITVLNLRGVKASVRVNQLLLGWMFIVVGTFIALAARFLYVHQAWHGLLSAKPFYDPDTFNLHRVLAGSSFAVLTYVGFDAITTLSEDVENQRRTVLLATVTICIFNGAFGCFVSYLGQRVWPDWHSFRSLETAFMEICSRVGGRPLMDAMNATIIVAFFGSGLTCGLGAAKLLFGMGRDGVLPKRLFGHVAPGTNIPSYNIILLGVLSFGGAVLLNVYGNAFQHAGELINFGAFLAFMGVNLATFWQFGVVRRRRGMRFMLVDAAFPLIGFGFCAIIWWNLSPVAKSVGGAWFVAGLIHLLIITKCFRSATTPSMSAIRERVPPALPLPRE